MNCASCGSPAREGDLFCTNCGASLAVSQPAPADAGLHVEAVEARPAASQPPAPTNPSEISLDPPAPGAAQSERLRDSAWTPPPDSRPSSSSRWLTLLALLLVLFGLAAAGGYFLQRTLLRKDQPLDTAAAQELNEPPPAVATATQEPEPENAPSVLGTTPSEPLGSGGPAERVSQPRAGEGATGDPATGGAERPATATGPTARPPVAARAERPGGGRPQGSPAVASASSGTASNRPTGEPDPATPRQGPAVTLSQATPPASDPGGQAQQSGAPEVVVAGGSGTATPSRPPREVYALTPDPRARPQSPPPAQAPSQPPPPGGSAGLKTPVPAPAPRERQEGVIYWSGRLTKNQVIVIERDRATIGDADGSLPGTPVDVWLPSPAVVLVERPNNDNNWSRVAFRCVQSTNRNVTLNIQWKLLR